MLKNVALAVSIQEKWPNYINLNHAEAGLQLVYNWFTTGLPTYLMSPLAKFSGLFSLNCCITLYI